MDDFFEKTVIESAKKLLEILKKNDQKFQFFNCVFRFYFDWYDVLKNCNIDGIEVLEERKVGDDPFIDFIPGLYISNIKFTKAVYFHQCDFNGTVNFDNVIFEKEFDFFDVNFIESVSIGFGQFNGSTQFRSVKAKQSFTIFNSSINVQRYGFRSGNYEKGLMLYNNIISTGLDLGDSIIKEVLTIRNGKINGNLNLSDCQISNLQIIGNQQFNQNLSLFELNLNNTILEGQLQINFVEILKDVKADSTKFEDIVFIDNSKFIGENFWTNAIFNKSVSIVKSQFEKHLSFAYSEFRHNCIFKKKYF